MTSPLPQIKKQNREKPLGYDASRDKFIYYDEIIAGKERITSPDALSYGQKKVLIIERNRAGPDYTVRTLNGQVFVRDDVIREIERDTDFGRTAVVAEISYLNTLLKQIGNALK